MWQGTPHQRQQICTITRGVMSKNTEIFTNIAKKTSQISQEM